MSDDYNKGMLYEAFMLRAFKKHDRDTSAKFDEPSMSNLILAEQGAIEVRHLPSASNMLADVKMYSLQAIDEYLKLNLTIEERDTVETARNNIERANHSSSILESIEAVLVATSRFKEY